MWLGERVERKGLRVEGAVVKGAGIEEGGGGLEEGFEGRLGFAIGIRWKFSGKLSL